MKHCLLSAHGSGTFRCCHAIRLHLWESVYTLIHTQSAGIGLIGYRSDRQSPVRVSSRSWTISPGMSLSDCTEVFILSQPPRSRYTSELRVRSESLLTRSSPLQMNELGTNGTYILLFRDWKVGAEGRVVVYCVRSQQADRGGPFKP